jgi:hypothetical protein
MASASRPVHAGQGGPLQRGDDTWKRSGAGSPRARAALEPSPGRLDPACCAQAFQFRRPDDPFGTAHTGNALGAAAFLNVLCAPQEPVNRYPQPRLTFPQPSKEHPTSRDGGRAPRGCPPRRLIWKDRPRAVGVVTCGHPPTGPPPPGTHRSIEPERCARNCRMKPSAGIRRGWH